MPRNREPAVYHGYVISQIGTSAGKQVTMDFKNAQNCVASGTHRWADDPTDMPVHVQASIDEREAARQKQIAEDALHFGQGDGAGERSAEDIDALVARARDIRVGCEIEEDNPEAKHFYLMSPLPPVIALDTALVEELDDSVDINDVGEITLTFENAKARYAVVTKDDYKIVAELVEATQPDVDIPENWRELHHLQQIAIAKAIRAASGSMKKDEAIAIIEDWTSTDDQVSGQEGSDSGEQGADASGEDQRGTEAANEFKDKDGNAISPEERARQAAKEFVEDDGA